LKTKHYVSLLVLFLWSIISYAQEATVTGIILDENNLPVPKVSVKAGDLGTVSNENGFYSLDIPANTDTTLEFSHIAYKKIVVTFNLKNGVIEEFNPVVKESVEQIATVVISSGRRKDVQGVLTIEPETIRKIPGANAGVENILLSLPGVSNNNELSTQYSVRGGNYDENLVYINGIEVYRPFLVRSGQQEGLSFVNSDLVQNVDFSAGGFQAKYGDKLSSVLDITYKTPYKFAANADVSLLGATVAVEGVSKDSKLTGILGARYRNNSLFVDARQTETDFTPIFADVQGFFSYKLTNKFHLSFLGNASLNLYDFQPISRQTNFGTLSDPIALVVFFDGKEETEYQTYFGALQGTYFPNDNLTLNFTASTYHTTEQEFFDILAQYNLGEVNTNIGDENLGDVEFSEGVGSQLTHGRNSLDALITTVQTKGDLKIDNARFEWSLRYTHEDIRDRLVEWEVIDSAGFSIRPPRTLPRNEQPFVPFEGDIIPFTSIRARNNTQINRIQAYAQWSKRGKIGESKVWYNAGLRMHNWTVKGDGISSVNNSILTPRAQFAIKPNWKKDMLFRFSGGFYYQPPFYRELRDSTGTVIPNVKSQKSYHAVIGNDYSFKMWDRPFKLTTEAYYKGITDVNPYTLENVRIRYRARNNARAFAYGLDLRLNGEFVPGTESWFSFGYLKTEENINNRGYIPRPTDQRLKFAALFQDYVPNIPSMKMYLNLVYNTGLPGGSPSFADPYDFQSRLKDYTRTDIGFQFVLADAKKQFESGWKRHFKELTLGLEIFNIFDVRNSITNTFVRDVSTQGQFAIPNFLTPRVFNVRTTMRF
jgi:hypothetical protein